MNRDLMGMFLFNEIPQNGVLERVSDRLYSASSSAWMYPGTGDEPNKLFDISDRIVLTDKHSFRGLNSFTLAFRIMTLATDVDYPYAEWSNGKECVLVRTNSTNLQVYTYANAEVGGTIDSLAAWTKYAIAIVYDGAKVWCYKNGVLSGTSQSQTGAIGRGSYSVPYVGYYEGATDYSYGMFVFSIEMFRTALSADMIRQWVIYPWGTPDNPRLI
jgi:hypothetical protein